MIPMSQGYEHFTTPPAPEFDFWIERLDKQGAISLVEPNHNRTREFDDG
jgi:hypothetical protein